MNKRVAIFMVLSLLVGVMIPFIAYGEESGDSLEGLTLRAKQILGISDAYDTFNSSISSYGGRTYYYFNWRSSSGELNEVNVTIDSDGFVTSYSTYDPRAVETQKLPSLTKDEAIDRALQFINRLDDRVGGSIEYDDTNYYAAASDPNYNLRFRRVVNGIPFNDNDVNISISKESGNVTSCYINWTLDAELKDPSGIISLEDARTAFSKKPGIQLVYKLNDQFPRPVDISGEELSHYLVYAPNDNITMIDPWTGEPVISGFSPYGMGGGKAEAMDQSGITPVEQEALEKLKGLLTSAEAEKIGRDYLDISEDFILDNQSLYSSWKNKDEYQWSMSYSKDRGEEQAVYIEISIDAKSGEVISFNINSTSNEGKKPTMDREEARAISEAFIKKTAPDLLDSIKAAMEYSVAESDRLQYFTYNRYQDGVLVEGDSLSVAVDLYDGEVVSFNKSWYKGSFPSSEGAISKEKAYDSLFGSVGFGLGYRIIPIEEKGIWSDQVRLVYQTDPQKAPFIDPFSGEALDYSGKPYRDKKVISYDDIDYSYAKSKITLLAEYGIALPGNSFLPKSRILQKDFMRLLWSAMNSYRLDRDVTDDTIYEELLNSGIVKENEVNREAEVSKADASRFAVRAKGLAKIAEIQGIYANIFKDSANIDLELKGYVTLAYGLGILKGDNTGYIRPDYLLKREDAASMIFEFAFN